MAGPRQPFALLLAFLAVALGLASVVAIHLRAEALDRRTFADNALEALDREPVRALVTDEISDRLLSAAPVDVIPRQTVETAVGEVVATRAFRRSFRRSAVEANRVLFDGTADAASLRLESVTAALAGVDPRLARLVPAGASLQLLTLRRDSLGVGTVRVADGIETTARVAPWLALAALAAALLVAVDRRRLLRAAGVLVVLGGVALLVALPVTRSTVEGRVDASAAVDPTTARAAAGEVFDVYADGLRVIGIVAIGGGLALAAAATILGGRRT
ncbi:hypothetical protein [Conexibacter arvalis]|uniref:Uncharacterized protein n=1 Tax=Conexibacter arvalis TaxID=912552 RepID=A0A840IDC3_9ACTN|nr:hypothetical protein [Conexibacter arvalis]MBB4662762.1 hypothetical protein [Conexibacter arvalis]